MVEQYKLRLGDGTVLAVDYDGLRTWLLDESAMVQPPGSRRWRPLKQHLVEQPSAPVRYAPPSPPLVVPVAPAPPPPPVVAAPVPVPPPPPAPAPTPPPAPEAAAPVPSEPIVQAAPVPRILRVKRQPPPPAAAPSPPPAPAPEIVAFRPAEDDEPPFHVGDEAQRPSLLDVAAAEVERHGGADPVWPWTPPEARKAAPLGVPDGEAESPGDRPEALEIDLAPEEPPPAPEPDIPIRLAPIALAPIPVAEWTPPAVSARSVGRPASASVEPPSESCTAMATPAPALPRRLETALRVFARAVDALLARIPRGAAPPSGTIAPPPAVTPSPARPDAVQPPPPLSALPVLRFAPTDEEARAVRSATPVPAGRARSWAARGFVALGVAGLAALAFATRSAWMPSWSGLSRPPHLAVSPLPPPPPRIPEPPSLPPEVQRAIAQLPHLSAETVQLVMSRSERGLPDPPEVFRFAHAAAIRGAAELTAEEGQELRALEKALLGSLSRPDRDRVRAYDRMSPERDLLVGEDAKVMALFTRGARALGSARRERLQALLGKAIAADLNRPPTP